MDWGVGLHGVDKSDVINTFADVREEVGNVFTALPVLFKFPAWFDDASLGFFAPATESFDVDGFPVHPDHVRFVVEGIDVARAAVHEEEDNAFGLGCEMGRAGRKWVAGRARAWRGFENLVEEPLFGEQSSQGEFGKTSTYVVEKFAAVGASAEVVVLSVHSLSPGKGFR